jgi:hypothetical protein
MGLKARHWLVGALVAAVFVTLTPSAFGAFGIESFVAVNCTESECAQQLVGPYSFPKEPSKAEAEAAGYTQAGGHVPFGITHFKVATTGPVGNEVPTGIVTHIRTDIAPGLSTNPTAVPQCTLEEFGATEALPGSGLYPPTACKEETEIGVNRVVVYVEGFGDVPLAGKVYNLVQSEGLASEFGVALELPKPLTEIELNQIFHGTQPEIEKAQYFAHTLIEGHIEWGQQPQGTGAGDYHDYFEINVSPRLPLISSRLVFFGRAGEGDFVVNPTNCEGNTTNTLTVTSTEGTARRTYTPPIGLTGCNLVPFEPGFVLTPETKKSDQPDGIAADLSLPHEPGPEALDSSQLRTATVVLPEGMTLNPAAAQGLDACTPAQARIHSPEAGTACPAKSEIGTFSLNVPDLPPGSLNGRVFLGGPPTGPITTPPFTVYLDAESARYGISVRLEGKASPNLATGRVTTVFAENPEQPFSEAIVKLKGGALAPIANPLVCGPAKTETLLVPYSGTVAKSPFSQFVVDANNSGGACASPLPFALSQGTAHTPSTGGANTSFTLNLTRSEGQQYLSKVTATLPPGLVGKIPAVPLCGEPQATLGTCSAASQIGTATVTVGAGPTPAPFSGPVYLTGPVPGAPYGMSVVIHAAVGPFDLGPVVTRAAIEVDPFSARVIVASDLPTIVRGVPLRLRTLSVAINRQGFLINPTNCGVLATETALTSTFGATHHLSTPFQASGCSSLSFKPRFSASSNAKASRKNGAAINVKVGYPVGPQANIKSVFTQLPKQLPSRLSTLKLACPEATFDANPWSCPRDSRVGGATVRTPVLPSKLTGPAYFVSHGGAAFPDLDLVLVGNGLEIVLVGKTDITKGITSSTFSSVPDVPVSSFELKLPVGPHSALAANGNLCAKALYMPTTITAQNGKVIKQRTRIKVSGCGVRILSHRVRGHRVLVTVQAPAAGRLSVGLHSSSLRARFRRVGKAGRVTLSAPLSLRGLRAHKPLRVRVRVGFAGSKSASVAFTKVTFR